MVLGAPVGDAAFCQAWCERKGNDLAILLHTLRHVPDAQCRWLLLKMCAEPRIVHALRTTLPPLVASLASWHDNSLWNAFRAY